jgi:hypothetical protein
MVASAGPSDAAPATTGGAAQASAVYPEVVVDRAVVHHAYTYGPAPAPHCYASYYGYYAPPPIVALPAAAACAALSLIGGC